MPISRHAVAIPAAILLAVAGCSGGGGVDPNQAQAAGITAQALQAAANEEPIRRFYEARQWQAAWSDEQAQALNETLQGAVRHGLDPAVFAGPIQQAGSPAEREVALTRAALAYAEALARGRVDPAEVAEVYTVPRPQPDLGAGLAQAINENNVGQWIEGLAPQDAEYQALSQAYLQARQAAQAPPQPQAGNSQQPPANGQQAAAVQDNMATRAMQLAVNLERRRWLERQPPATRIDVNIAAAFLRYHRDGNLADQRIVITGEPGWETPELGSPLYRLVANPDWTVPQSIEEDELGGLSPAALQRRNMSRENGRIVQQPGPDNALGQVKFDMQNDHAIYLHDTPAKAAFQRPERHLSHGCVRVHDALGFARMIAEHSGKLDEFNRALATRDTNMVPLAQPIPVRLMYQTAFVDNGQLRFVEDVYGWDVAVARALGLEVPAGEQRRQQRRQREAGDYGP